MIKFSLIVRTRLGAAPHYVLDFEAPQLPREGDYLSVRRPVTGAASEDMIVRKVWWRFAHPMQAVFDTDYHVGALTEAIVECEAATSLYSSEAWRERLVGSDAPQFDYEGIPPAASET
jgi:hypothetical protein